MRVSDSHGDGVRRYGNEFCIAHEVGWDMLSGEVLKYYLEHPKHEFDKWRHGGNAGVRHW